MLVYGMWFLRAAGSGLIVLTGLSCFLIAMFSGPKWYWPVGIGLVLCAAGGLSWPRMPNRWRSDPPTDRQLSYANDLGIVIPAGVSKGQLSDLISAVKSA